MAIAIGDKHGVQSPPTEAVEEGNKAAQLSDLLTSLPTISGDNGNKNNTVQISVKDSRPPPLKFWLYHYLKDKRL